MLPCLPTQEPSTGGCDISLTFNATAGIAADDWSNYDCIEMPHHTALGEVLGLRSSCIVAAELLRQENRDDTSVSHSVWCVTVKLDKKRWAPCMRHPSHPGDLLITPRHGTITTSKRDKDNKSRNHVRKQKKKEAAAIIKICFVLSELSHYCFI